MKKILPILLFISLFGEGLISQQVVTETTSSAGGIISGEDITLLYSIGQPFVNRHSHDEIVIQEGILQGLLKAYTLNNKEELLSIELFTYPNPTKDFIKIQNDFQNHGDLTIYTSSGHQILNRQILSDEVVDIQNLPNGNYFVSLTTDTSQGICSLIKI